MLEVYSLCYVRSRLTLLEREVARFFQQFPVEMKNEQRSKTQGRICPTLC